MKKLLIILFITLSSFCYGNEDNNIYFQPVEEVFVDELPEWITDLEYVHSVSRLPIVFRGAAKNWEAMNWTPESLASRGLKRIEKLMENSDKPQYHLDSFTIGFENGERSIIAQTHAPLEIFKEVHFYEKNLAKDISEKDAELLKDNANLNLKDFIPNAYLYLILAGTKGLQIGFHKHTTVLLAEFYGEKMVFLAPPHSLCDGDDLLIKASDDAIARSETEKDCNIKSETFSPWQQVILKPGDILYIPSGWFHRVHYLTTCMGVTQFILIDRMNV